MTTDTEPRRALLDVSVFRLGFTSQVVRVPLGRDGRGPDVLGITRKPSLPPDQRWRQEQIEAMPTLVTLVRHGQLRLFMYTELDLEAMKGTYVGTGGIIGDLFRGLAFEDVPAAIGRSKLQQMSLDEYAKKETFINFCKYLLGLDYASIQARPGFLRRFTEFEQENFRHLDRFKRICSALTENHYPDAFHLWTAEASGIGYFLTADRAFTNALTMTSRVPLPTRPMSPSDLLTQLGVTQLDPMPLTDDRIYPLQ